MEEDAAATKDIRRDVQRWHQQQNPQQAAPPGGGGGAPERGAGRGAAAGGRPGAGPRGRPAPPPTAARPGAATAGTTAGERQIASLIALSDSLQNEVAWCSDEHLIHATMALAFSPNFIQGGVLQKNRRANAFKCVRRPWDTPSANGVGG